MLIVSSVVTSFEDLLSLGGGDDPFPGGVADLRDLLEPRERSRDLFEPREGVRYGVSCGVGREAAAVGPPYSSSVSHTAMSSGAVVEQMANPRMRGGLGRL